eukprot:1683233-Prymnesium_polylepis.1
MWCMSRRHLLLLLLPPGTAAWPRQPKPREGGFGSVLMEAGRAALKDAVDDVKGTAASAQRPTLSFLDRLLTSDGEPDQRSLLDDVGKFLSLSVNATGLERKAWGKDLAAAFENFRVPAALVAGTAISLAFALLPVAEDAPMVGLAKRAYLLCSLCSFVASIIVVALATSALVQLNQQDSGRDTPAADLEDFMRRAGYSLELWVA